MLITHRFSTYLPVDFMLNMNHPEFSGAGITVIVDVLFVQKRGCVQLKSLLDSVVNVRPMCHAGGVISPRFSWMINRLYETKYGQKKKKKLPPKNIHAS